MRHILKAQVWIAERHTQKVLLFETTAKRGGFWQPVTGSVEEGESPLEGARRELLEETGFECEPMPLDYSFTFETQRNNEAASVSETCFYVFLEKGRDPKLDPTEHQNFRWVTAEDAQILLKHESNRHALSLLKEKLH